MLLTMDFSSKQHYKKVENNMKKLFLILILLLIISISSFSQGEDKTDIQWLSLNKAEKLAEKYDSDILIFFFRNGCPDCKKMKEQTIKNPKIIKLINDNFFPVILNGRTKDTIVYNGKKYTNQQPIKDGSTFRHDLYHELVIGGGHQYYYPYIVIINGDHQIIKYLPGFYPAARLERSLLKLIQ